MSPAGQGDDKATFLAEFRALRDQAALDFEELAARAHYPTEVLKEAESGPGLPGLPILAAYVRACGGDVIEWEERWRLLAIAADADAGLPVRPAGASAAAVAGARAGVTVVPADAHDPERIKAALRAHREREEQATRSGLAPSDAGLSGQTMDPRNATAVRAPMLANGNHHKQPRSDSFGTSIAQAPTQLTRSAPTLPTAPREASAPAASAGAEEGFQAFTATVSRTAEAAPTVSSAPATGSAKREATSTAAPTAQRRQAATEAAKPASRRAPRSKSGHPALLLLFVVLVLIGCVALLTFT
jgi:hypothetical protein